MTDRSVKKNKSMSPRTKQVNEQLKQKRREQIILTALENFANRGYHRSSISEISKAAGISKGLIYNYFESKEDLLINVLKFVLLQAVDTIFKSIDKKSKTLTPLEMMAYGIGRFFDVMQKEADLWKLSISLAMQVADIPNIHQVLVQMFDMVYLQIEQLLKVNEVPDASVKARLIAAQLDGIALHYFVMGNNYDLETIKRVFINEITS